MSNPVRTNDILPHLRGPAKDPMTTRLDTHEVRHAATGRWPNILEHIGGCPREILDGKYHPCPSCGGKDCFYLFDDDSGGAICMQCHGEDCGDGFATLQWLTGDDFPKTLARVADFLGMCPTPSGNGQAEPNLLDEVCRQKRMSVDSAKAYGAHITKRGRLDVVRFPVVNKNGVIHSHFDLAPDGQKEWFAKGSGMSGLFLPIDDSDRPKLPVRDEEWIVCEGVNDAAAYHGLGYFACGLPTDQLAAKYARLFRDCHIVLMPNRTTDAEVKAQKSADRLHGIAASVRVGTLPLEIGSEKGDDARDVLKLQDGERLLRESVDDAIEWQPPARPAGKRKSQATVLVSLAESVGLELFHSPGADPDGFGVVPIDDHHETWRLKSKAFGYWLQSIYWNECNDAANSQAIHEAISVLNAKALHNEPEKPVFVRMAELDGAVWIDLANTKWQAVRIDVHGWQVVDSPPTGFVRPRGMLPLATPEHGGTVDDLRSFVNVGGDNDWLLIVSWLIAALRPCGPFPVLEIHGEQGAAKSTVSRMLRALVDPNRAALRSEPRNERDLAIAASNSWVIALENLSRIQPWLSDAICRLSTGGGFGTRQLFSDDEEKLFSAMRPVMVNGITELAARPDLLDRSILITLPTIPDANRRTEKDLWNKFDAAMPKILGALLSTVSTALANVDGVELDCKPRMADFAQWGVAAEPSLTCETGEFLAAYLANRETANESAIESSVIAEPMVALLDDNEEWTGTPTELLYALEEKIPERTAKQRAWPKRPHNLSGELKRIAPNLRRMGIDVEFGKKSGNRFIHLSRMGKQNSVQSVHSIQNGDGEGGNGHSPASHERPTASSPATKTIVKNGSWTRWTLRPLIYMTVLMTNGGKYERPRTNSRLGPIGHPDRGPRGPSAILSQVENDAGLGQTDPRSKTHTAPNPGEQSRR